MHDWALMSVLARGMGGRNDSWFELLSWTNFRGLVMLRGEGNDLALGQRGVGNPLWQEGLQYGRYNAR